METSTLPVMALPGLLAQSIQAGQADLVAHYRQALRECVFTNRTQVTPRQLAEIAAGEADFLNNYLLSPGQECRQHGEQYAQSGLSEQSILSLGKAARQFLAGHLAIDLISPALDIYDSYQNTVMQGYIQSREKIILQEQEEIRSALQRTISRYTVEIKEIRGLAQEASEASTFKSHFIAQLSHELRTPVGVVLGFAEILDQGIFGTLDPKQQDIVRRIIDNAHNLEQVFSELLDQSHIESGQLKLKEEPFSPKSLAQTVYSNQLPFALKKGLALRTRVDPNLPLLLMGDELRARQILTNLVVNAIKYTEEGSVSFRLRKNGGGQWIMEVSDTGIGIPTEAQAHIFEPFRQVEEFSGRRFGGVGLGLAIVAQLVKAMNGDVQLQSEVGKGSTFQVSLPLRSAD